MPAIAWCTSRTTCRVVRLGLAALFLVAGAFKLAAPQNLAVTVKALGLLPAALAEPLSWGLPVVEIAAALLLALDKPGGLGLVTGLLCVFVLVLVYARTKGLDIDCGCYGPGDPEREAFSSIRTALWRDAAMLAACAYLFWWRRVTWREAHVGAAPLLNQPNP